MIKNKNTFKNFGNKNGNWARVALEFIWFNILSNSLRAGVSSFNSNDRSAEMVPDIFSVFVTRDIVYLYWTFNVTLFSRSSFNRFKSGGEMIQSDVEFGPLKQIKFMNID